MAGGKETPRQKMVGLMYLVLMALLALNVTKSVLDAFVAIEDNIQKACVKQLDRGDGYIAELKEELSDRTNPVKVQKVQAILGTIQQIDQLTAQQINTIDALKIELLKKSGENIELIKMDDKISIIWQPYSKKDPIRPARLNLSAVEAKDQYDIPMHEIIGEELSNVTGAGKTVWKNYNSFRNQLCTLVGSYQNGDKKYQFIPKAINTFKDNKDLNIQVDALLNSQPINKNEDYEILKQLYTELTKNEFIQDEEEGKIHWIAKTFNHSPLVAAIASLSSLEQEILTARASAIGHLKGKVSAGEYSFNKVTALAYAPPAVKEGDDFEVRVMMAAYDSDNQPIVTYNQQAVKEVKDGYGLIKLKAGKSKEMNLSGTVAIRKKTGEMKQENWSTKVQVLQPQGTISIPVFNMLYRDFPIEIQGNASGFDQTIVTGDENVSIQTINGKTYATAKKGKTCNITIYGLDTRTKRRQNLGTSTYRIVGLPDPDLYFGNLKDGQKEGKSVVTNISKLFLKYDATVPLSVPLKIVSWELKIPGTNLIERSKGDILTAKAMKNIKMVAPGQSFTFIVDVLINGKLKTKPLTIFVK